jgi:predicted nucleic acid-binding protein
MRVVLDTNILVSALIAPAGKPAAIVDAWLDGKFTLLTCGTHLDAWNDLPIQPTIFCWRCRKAERPTTS